MQAVKCVLVGDSASEKTQLLFSYTTKMSSGHVPKVFDNYAMTVMIGGKPFKLLLHDTTGQTDYDKLRSSIYPQTDVFLVCFSVVSPSTFENVKTQWVPEISHHNPGTPFLIVGTQIDLRKDSKTVEKIAKNQQCSINPKSGENLARELRAVKYMECSALTMKGVDDVFNEAILAALDAPKIKIKKICVPL